MNATKKKISISTDRRLQERRRAKLVAEGRVVSPVFKVGSGKWRFDYI